MRRINYKSDIPPLLLSLKVDENQITVPDCDFIVRFYIEGYEGRHYDCSHIGGVWSNCEPSEDGTKLVCYINNQRLGIGELCAEFHYISPDRRYSDGSQKSVVIIDSTELGVELVEDNGDAVTEAAIDVTLPFIYRTAYEIARDHGYTGTAEDFYSALASVVGIADAEKKRVTAEITRNANEQERIENEENRLNAENDRVNAEAQRVMNEAIRRDAESDRVEQEEDRKAKFEEITEFIATVRANEGNRESNERERQTNEDTRITEEAKRVEAEKKRAAEFEQQKLDLTGKINRSGDEMGGDLIFTDNAGVSFRTSDGGAHAMFNDTDDVAKFTADNGDTFEFKQNETPNKNSSAIVVSANLYNALDMTLNSMGSALDGDAAYHAEAGDKIFNPDTGKIQRYNSTIGGFEDLCDPIEGKLYVNKLTGYIYRWNTKAKKMVFVGGVKAYTKDEADSRFAKLDDATQRVKANELEATNSVTTKSMWIGDEGLLLGGDGNGHLTVEQDELITDVTLNEKLATKADDVAYGVEWNNGQPTGEMQETTVKEATKNTTIAALFLGQSVNELEQEVEKKVDKTDIVQSTGTSETAVMSQKAITHELDTLGSNISELEGEFDNITDYSINTFDIKDEKDNVIIALNDGHIRTKKFDSKEVVSTGDAVEGDLEVNDENGNTIVRFQNGHIKTKRFSSDQITPENDDYYEFSIKDNEGNAVLAVDKEGNLKTKNFDSGSIDVPKSAFRKSLVPKIDYNKKTFRWLDIGNSHSYCALFYLRYIALSMGVDLSEVAFCTLSRGAASFSSWVNGYHNRDYEEGDILTGRKYSVDQYFGGLNVHVKGTAEESGIRIQIDKDLGRVPIIFFGDDTSVMHSLLKDNEWDLITIHQQTNFYDYYNESDGWINDISEEYNVGSVDKFIRILKTCCPKATIGFLQSMTPFGWNGDKGVNYDVNSFSRTLKYYNDWCSYIRDFTVKFGIDFIIPCNTALQNLCMSDVAQTDGETLLSRFGFYYDYVHTAFGVAAYTMAATAWEMVFAPRFNKSIYGNNLVELSEDDIKTTTSWYLQPSFVNKVGEKIKIDESDGAWNKPMISGVSSSDGGSTWNWSERAKSTVRLDSTNNRICQIAAIMAVNDMWSVENPNNIEL